MESLIFSLALAATFHVPATDNADHTGASCANGECTSLRAAITAATSGQDFILLDTAVYQLNGAGSPTPSAEDANANGDLDLTSSVTIVGNSDGGTVIDGGGRERVLDIPATAQVTLRHLTIRNGAESAAFGGGVRVGAQANVVIDHCTIGEVQFPNHAASGGGLAVTVTSVVLLADSDVIGNVATGTKGAGGGIYVNNGATLTVLGGTVRNNAAFNGAGIADTESAINSLDHVAITDNTAAGTDPNAVPVDQRPPGTYDPDAAPGGGGIFVNDGAIVSVNNCAIRTNRSSAMGGGIYLQNVAMLVTDTTIADNQANWGGAAGLGNGGKLFVHDSTLSGNLAAMGAGVIGFFSSTFTATNSTLAGNQTSQANSATVDFSYNSSPSVTLSNVTMAGNTGGSLYADFQIKVATQNSILTDTPTCFTANGASILSGGNNLFGDATCPTGGAGDVANAAPLLDVLADNGGATQTRALLTGSPAIDHGNSSGCSDENGALLQNDQRGTARSLGGPCDIGAFERVPADVSVTVVSEPAAPVPGGVVVYTFTVANAGPGVATGVALTEPLAGAAFVSAQASQGSCAQNADTVSCALGAIASGQSVIVTVVLTVPANGIAAAAPSVSTSAPDATRSNDTTATAAVAAAADLGLSLTASQDTVPQGGSLTYDIAVNNAGPSDASAVSITHTLPPGVSFVSASPTSCTETNGTVACAVGVLKTGSAFVARIIVTTPKKSGDLLAAASVTAAEPDPVSANNRAQVTTSTSAPAKTGCGCHSEGVPAEAALFCLLLALNRGRGKRR